MLSTEETDDGRLPPPFEVRSFGLSDQGRKRDRNEDCFSVAELVRTLQVRHTNLPQNKSTLSSHRAHIFLVADGVGGNRAGDVASGLGVTAVEDFLLNTLRRFSNLEVGEEQDALRAFQDALRRADSRIFEAATGHPEWQGMGTTLTMAFAVDWRLFVAHAGDSRCYIYSSGKLQRLTQDHTMTAEMVRLGMIPTEKIARHPWRNIVTNILGGKERGVQVELHQLELHPEDLLLLCSDGLTEMVPEERIAAVLQAENDPKRACKCLIAEANRLGGHDNITAIVARFSSFAT